MDARPRRGVRGVAGAVGAALLLGAAGLVSGASPALGAVSEGLTPDPGFTAQLGGGFDGPVRAVLADSGGGYLVGGDFTTLDGTDVPDDVVRLLADGTPDPVFNGNLGSGLATDSGVFSLLEASGGGFLVGGRASTLDGVPVPNGLVRLLPDGSLDVPFTSQVQSLAQPPVLSIAEDAGGGFLLGSASPGFTWSPPAQRGLQRLLPDGAQDIAFNSRHDQAGLGTQGFSGVLAVAPDPAGGVLVGGTFSAVGAVDTPDGLVRLLADGSLDGAFDARLGAGFDGAVRSVVVHPDGSVLVGGDFTTLDGQPVPAGLVRLAADGSVDAAFVARLGAGLGGAPVPAPASGLVSSLAVAPDGSVLVAGDFADLDGRAVPRGLVRLGADGSLDEGFVADLGSGFDGPVRAAVPDAAGGILVAGDITSLNGDPAVSDGLVRLAPGALELGALPDRTDLVGQAVDLELPVVVAPAGVDLVVTATGLPAGVGIADPATGRITGVLTEAGEHTVEVTVAATATPTLRQTATFAWTVRTPQAPTIAGSPGDGEVGQEYAFDFTVTGTPSPSVAVTDGVLPDGLALSPAGRVTGVPTTAQVSTVEVTAVNGVGSATTRVTFTVVAAPVSGTPWLGVEHAQRAPGQVQVATAGGFAPGEQVTLTLTSTPVRVATATADAGGALRVAFTVPADTTAGTHTLTAAAGSGTAATTFTVTRADGPVHSRLARSGLAVLPGVAVAAVLVAAGAWLVRAGGPRRVR